LIVLHGTQKAFGWSVFDGGSTFATKIAAAAAQFDDRYQAGAYVAAGLTLFALTFLVNALARGVVAGVGKRRGNR
jgi:phosphate transport system permease protein